jgi:TolA-binding protein
MNAPVNRCREDLFARSRRGPLSVVEQRALDAHLAICVLCRAASAFAAAYDAVPDDQGADDDLLIARLVERVAGGAKAVRPRRHPRVLAAAAGLALLVAAGGAAAWVSVHGLPSRSLETRVLARPEGAPRAEVARASAPGKEAAARGEPSGRVPNGEKRSPPNEKSVVRHVAASEHGSSPREGLATPDATPAELFAEANAARRARDLRRASDLYLALDRRFPESAEAPVALVSAGDLLSRLGEPAAALQAFDRYLDRRPSGALAPEALFGRARALRQLARRQDEVDTWRRLLDTFPGSIYESAGRQRLGELLR